jgi:hypothetical protein
VKGEKKKTKMKQKEKMNKYEFKIEKCVDISEALCERDRYCFNCGNIQNKKWDSCQKCCDNKDYIKSKIKGMLEDLHILYNQSVEDYSENGEEDFNCWLEMFKERGDKTDE